MLRYTDRSSPIRRVTVLPLSVSVTAVVPVGLAERVALAPGRGGPGVTRVPGRPEAVAAAAAGEVSPGEGRPEAGDDVIVGGLPEPVAGRVVDGSVKVWAPDGASVPQAEARTSRAIMTARIPLGRTWSGLGSGGREGLVPGVPCGTARSGLKGWGRLSVDVVSLWLVEAVS